MAEGLVKEKFGERYIAFSAGTHPSSVNPYAIKVMTEIGIDISKHTSNNLTEFLEQEIDYIITVCDRAQESCPIFPGGKNFIHKSFENPVDITGSEEDILDGFRRVRDKIREWVLKQFG